MSIYEELMTRDEKDRVDIVNEEFYVFDSSAKLESFPEDTIEKTADMLCEVAQTDESICDNCPFNCLCGVGHTGSLEWLKKEYTED